MKHSPGLRLTRAEFAKLVRAAIDDLPVAFRRRIVNLAFLIKRESPSGQRLLGLYQGVPFSRRDGGYHGALPDRITLFQRPIERCCRNKAAAVALVRRVILHEVGHYFGFGEAELRKWGY